MIDKSRGSAPKKAAIMQKRIFRSLFLIAFTSVLLGTVLIVSVLYGVFTRRLRQELKSEAGYVAAGLEQAIDIDAYFAQAEKDVTRITLIAADGTVLYDSVADEATMENHADRPEVLQARSTGVGESTRPSATLGEETLYYARRLKNGSVIRVSESQKNIAGMVYGTLPALLGLSALTLILTSILSRMLTRRVIAPLNALNLDDPLNNAAYDELSPLLKRLEDQNRQIDVQIRELSARRDEFEAIADNMREGLVVLNARGMILSINKSARRLFRAGSNSEGRHFMTLDRSLQLQTAVEQATSGVPAEAQMTLRGRDYQLLTSPVREKGAVTGIVALILDVTEQQAQERMRREFSANVSHELKTPLTSISGYAELIMSGVAKAEDAPGFARRIHDESSRLLALIDDILHLSRLDEGGAGLLWESVELSALSLAVIERLAGAARNKDVTISAEGGPAQVYGVKQVLEEMLYNLVDNSIRYNRPGGSVHLKISQGADGGAIAMVTDTGIGIPPEHQSRVFERFYRVDKSHARQTGGTGLGLSIVKRGALLHGANLELTSEQGKGTTIRVRFQPDKTGCPV